MAEQTADGMQRLELQGTQPGAAPLIVDASEFRLEMGATDENAPVDEGVPRVLKSASITQAMAAELGIFGEDEAEDDRVVEGGAHTDTGSFKVLGISLQPNLPEKEVALEPVVRENISQFGARPKTAVPSLPSSAPVEGDIQQHFRILTRLADTFGPPDPDVEAAITRILSDLDAATQRDELGDAIVNNFAALYESATVLTLSGPRAVIWRKSQAGIVDTAGTGATIEIRDGSVLHRIAQERVFYWGPLPQNSRLRVALNVAHSYPVFVAPVELRSKTIIMLVLDGGLKPFRSPGAKLERLVVELSKGLERVILLRKRGRRR